MLEFLVRQKGEKKLEWKTTNAFEIVAYDTFKRCGFKVDEAKDAMHLYLVLISHHVTVNRFDVIYYISKNYHIIKAYREDKLVREFSAFLDKVYSDHDSID